MTLYQSDQRFPKTLTKSKNKLVNQITFSMAKIPYHFCQTHSAWPLCENCSHTAFSKSLLRCWAKASGSRWRSLCGGSPVTRCATVNTWQKSTSLENIVFNMNIVEAPKKLITTTTTVNLLEETWHWCSYYILPLECIDLVYSVLLQNKRQKH